MTLNHNWRSVQSTLDVQKVHYAEMRRNRTKCAFCSGAEGEGALLNKDGACWMCGRVNNTPKGEVDSGERVRLIVETGETTEQLTLSEELFDRYAVVSVKVSIGGTIEIPLEMLEQMTAGLEPGDTVAFTCRGHVADVSTPYRVKDHGHDGRLVLKAEILHGVQVLNAEAVEHE